MSLSRTALPTLSPAPPGTSPAGAPARRRRAMVAVNIGTRLGVRGTAPQGIIEPRHRQRVGTGNEHQISVRAGVAGGPQLHDHVGDGHHLFAIEVAAALGKRLVLNVQRRYAGCRFLGLTTDATGPEAEVSHPFYRALGLVPHEELGLAAFARDDR